MAEYTETVDDLIRKYQRSYVFYEDKLTHISTFDSLSDGKIYFVGSSPENIGVEIIWDASKLKEISLVKGFYNFTNCPVVKLCRTSNKQWRRSLSQDNTQQVFPSLFIYKAINFPFPIRTIQFGWNQVQQIIEPSYPTKISEILDLLKKQDSVAITKNMMLCVSPYEENEYLVGALNGFIGVFSEKKGIVVHHTPMFQEVSDILFREKLTEFKVSCYA